jgi:superfamily II DNA or RNA helicase
VRSALAAGELRPLLQLPTGGGKTAIAANIILKEAHRGRVLFTVPALELVDQTAEAFRHWGVRDVGVMQGNHPLTDRLARVQVATVQTLRRRAAPDVGLVLVDEAHRQDRALFDRMASEAWRDVPVVGLTATPWTKGLGRHFGQLIVAETAVGLMEAGYLSQARVFAPSKPDLSKVRIRAGDYDVEGLSLAMRSATLVGDVVDQWLARAEHRPTLAFCVDRLHAKTVQAHFEAAGVPCGYLDGQSPKEEREEVRAAFASGRLKVVANVGVLTTGVDWDVRCVILARPTKSEMLFCQIVGRGLRTAPGKDHCLILDHTGTTADLGFAWQIHHDELDDGSGAISSGRKAARERADLRTCRDCKAVYPTHEPRCPECGWQPMVRSKVTSITANLVEIDHDRAARMERLDFLRELKAIGIEGGKSRNWPLAFYRQKFSEWPAYGVLDTLAPAKAVREETRRWVKSRQIAYAKGRGMSPQAVRA